MEWALSGERACRALDLGQTQHNRAGITTEFMQVTRPVMRLDMPPMRLADCGRGQARVARMTGDEQAENLRHILAPVSQRRKGDLDRA